MTNSLRVIVGAASRAVKLPDAPGLHALLETRELTVQASPDVQMHPREDGSKVFVVGDLQGLRSRSGDWLDRTVALSALSRRSVRAQSDGLEGRFVIGELKAGGGCEIWTDRFGQRELYYQSLDSTTVIATSLDLLPVSRDGVKFDQMALAHALTVYGYRPPKRHTYYQGVRRLGVDESISIADGRVTVVDRPFSPVPTGQYGERELGEYADTFIEAVRARGSADGNTVYLSSGWDSTAILACLTHLFGNRHVQAVIGRMTYAHRSGVINQFEIDRARAVADYFGVKLHIVEFNYADRGPELLERLLPLLRSHQIASVVGLNHASLAEGAAKVSDGGPVFAGEISDGAHNLGFSQFATIFHSVLAFREYSDKMASYLFGPTFLQLLLNNRFENDEIYGFLRGRLGQASLEPPATGGNQARTRQLLSSFFLRGNRFPFWSLNNTNMLTGRGREAYSTEMEGAYLARASAEATPETLYSWYLHLYNSFHWQGSTVTTLPLTAEAAGLQAALPFWDSRLQQFLAAMPESWGRGLDLNPTKYPLKWTLTHRVKYPLHLQVGPHSYLYDVDPTFSHSAELLYGSALGPYFKDVLKRRQYQSVLSSDVFDMSYLDGLVGRYLAGTEARGAEMNDLMSIAILSSVGWYGTR